MKDFRASLGCVLLVLGQLCRKSEIEINLSVDFSVEVTAPRPICNKSGEASCFFNTARTIVRVLHVSTGYGS